MIQPLQPAHRPAHRPAPRTVRPTPRHLPPPVSLRTPHPGGLRRPGWASRVPWVLAAAGILTQIAFPLTGGGTFVLTVAAVVLLAGASLAHAWVSRGPAAAAALLVVAGGLGFAVEAVGLETDVPFGAYDYSGSLGVEALGVPLLVPLAWIMMAWPALLVARRLTAGRSRLVTALVAAWALTAWDVFLDPQMVDAGHWAWDDPTPALPGVPGIPLTNYVGWLLAAFVISWSLDRVVGAGTDGPPVAVYVWTFFSSVMANAVFFGRPSVALVGAVVMGVVALPLVAGLVRDRRRAGG